VSGGEPKEPGGPGAVKEGPLRGVVAEGCATWRSEAPVSRCVDSTPVGRRAASLAAFDPSPVRSLWSTHGAAGLGHAVTAAAAARPGPAARRTPAHEVGALPRDPPAEHPQVPQRGGCHAALRLLEALVDAHRSGRCAGAQHRCTPVRPGPPGRGHPRSARTAQQPGRQPVLVLAVPGRADLGAEAFPAVPVDDGRPHRGPDHLAPVLGQPGDARRAQGPAEGAPR
jgi:hypothetical protein